ncbi:type II secretion system protein [Gordonibacter sp. An230]|uniref:type II secretion system F family protein n=1 Tax=Gordonibacter sp. An230 TaxID=1965592 RepID=UPI000B54D181|nr:type II secretion system F family protein [Gordonibacter sp. An230]OUO92130.1 type II secretion system protein [Gordonibacter sp. An230]
MMAMAEGALAVMATVSAGAAGAFLGAQWRAGALGAARRKALRRAAGADGQGVDKGLDGRLVRLAIEATRRIELGLSSASVARRLPIIARVEGWLGEHGRRAGCAEELSALGLVDASVRLGAASTAAGAIAGATLSNELSLVGALVGMIWGASAVSKAVRRRERARAASLERDLSEMLEVVALGLRSGLSFDRSFELYAGHFETEFAAECARAHRAWTTGLATREEALRSLAASYDSPLLGRVVESAVRSLRFGASLAEGFEASAAEARAAHRAHVEERVAKAPVKMMVPTGALILPAMLLLVLGPVLLELMEGF